MRIEEVRKKIGEIEKRVKDLPRACIKVMQEHHVKKLVVLEHGWLVGIITTNDIAVLHPKIIENIGKLLSKSFEELE